MASHDPHFTDFVRNGSEEAFGRLVSRHMGMVHSTARRLLGDRREGAADVAQAVFSLLARRAGTLPADLVVSVWLHKQTVRTALNVIRGENRRAARERTAADLMKMNAPESADVNATLMPHIDRAIAELAEVDQRVLALRFFERCELREIGERLGLSPAAVQKRLSRALEKLRGQLSRRGVALSAPALALWLSRESVQAVPASVKASALTAVALQAAGPGAGGYFSILTFMSGIKFILLGTALGLAGGGFWGIWVDSAPAPLSSQRAASSLRTPGGSGAAMAQRFSVPPPAGSAEGLLTQLLGMVSGPDNEFTRQRLAVWLEAVPKDLWPPLLELADRHLSEDERVRWMADLARQSARVNPAAAIPVLAKRRVRAADRSDGARLAAIGFKVWHGSEPDKALHWLLEQQDNPALVNALPGIISVVAETLAASSGNAAVQWAGQLQGDDLRKAALQPVWEKLDREEKANGSGEAWREACGKLLEEPDPAFRRLALSQALSAWTNGADSRSKGQRFGATEQWLAALPPSPEKTMAAELLLGEAARTGNGTPPGTTIGTLASEGPETAGQAAVRAVVQSDKIGLNAREWLLPLLSGPEREGAIFHAARLTDYRGGDWSSAQPCQGEAILWAAELSDPAVRDPLIYGIFQRWLEFEKKGGAESGNHAAPWLEKSALSPEIKSMLAAAYREFKAKGNP